jgi:hypothetical protein
MSFRVPPDARWNPERSAVEFGIGGEYDGMVRVSRPVFQHLLAESACTTEDTAKDARVIFTCVNDYQADTEIWLSARGDYAWRYESYRMWLP